MKEVSIPHLSLSPPQHTANTSPVPAHLLFAQRSLIKGSPCLPPQPLPLSGMSPLLLLCTLHCSQLGLTSTYRINLKEANSLKKICKNPKWDHKRFHFRWRNEEQKGATLYKWHSVMKLTTYNNVRLWLFCNVVFFVTWSLVHVPALSLDPSWTPNRIDSEQISFDVCREIKIFFFPCLGSMYWSDRYHANAICTDNDLKWGWSER